MAHERVSFDRWSTGLAFPFQERDDVGRLHSGENADLARVLPRGYWPLGYSVRFRSRIVEFLSFIEFNEGTSFEFELKTWRFDSKRSFFLSFFLVTVRKESKEGNRIDKFHRVIETRSRYQLIKCNIRSYRGFSQRDITSIVRASFGVIKNE